MDHIGYYNIWKDFSTTMSREEFVYGKKKLRDFDIKNIKPGMIFEYFEKWEYSYIFPIKIITSVNPITKEFVTEKIFLDMINLTNKNLQYDTQQSYMQKPRFEIEHFEKSMYNFLWRTFPWKELYFKSDKNL